ncbi:TPA: hypothetical protein J1487_004136 [Escherichia coli]|nr:hypothetical protein [Escherichia coli]HBA9842456.1 hypothetical protein [Escherichia coli]
MKKISLSEIGVNSTDPRQNKEFLWLSYSMNNLKSSQYDRIYWMTLEKRCLSLFGDKGYDLQTGAWYCLIAAQLYSWQGLAEASWIFAECFAKEQECWPPVSASRMRAQIMGWYIRQVIPLINILSDEERIKSSLSLLENALVLLSKIENDLFPENTLIINQALSELRQWGNDNRRLFYKIKKQQDVNISPVNELMLEKQIPKNRMEWKNCTLLVFSFLCGSLIPMCFSYFENPEVAWKINNNLPNTFLAELSMKYSKCSNFNFRKNDKWTQLNNKLENFERKLNISEESGKYITISELKTIAYDMKNILLRDDIPIETRIELVYNNTDSDREKRKLEMELIGHQIEQLNCQLGELRAKSE